MFKSLTVYVIITASQLLFPEMLFPEWLNNKSDTLKIFIIAGQSNAINIHSDAADLDTALIDTSVRFYYHCGMPPDSNIPFFSTSDNKWTNLKIQRQVPYIAHKEYFFGPEITLIDGIRHLYDNIAVIKCAYGGSNLAADWNPYAVSGNMLYNLMLGQLNNACHILDSIGVVYTFAGFFWIQGESDASNLSYAQKYFENLREFILKFRIDAGNSDLPFFVSRLPSGQPYTYLNLVRSAQERAAIDIPYTKWIDTDSLVLDSDNVHFVSSSMKVLGNLLAESFLNTPSSINEQHITPKKTYVLNQNYPNPFNPATSISFSLPERTKTSIVLFDALGREIRSLVSEEIAAGTYTIKFNAADLTSGIYYYQIRAGEFIETKKMIFLK